MPPVEFVGGRPVRLYLNPIERREWGETTILPHVIVNNVWAFVGYRF